MRWKELNQGLEKHFVFTTPEQAKAWVKEAENLANSIGHHPDRLRVGGNKVMVRLLTHDAGNKVTNKDWELSEKLDSLFYTSSTGVKTHALNESKANLVWARLYLKQLQTLKDKAHPLFWKGLEVLRLPQDKIPNLTSLNNRLKILANFEMERTPIQYAGDKEWFGFLSNRRIMVTNYIRVEKDLEFTPLPDIFHDVFGHLTLLWNKEVTDLAEKFGDTFNHAKTDSQRFMVERLWWNSLEFGLMKAKGKKVIIGAGLLSSSGERAYAFSKKAKHILFKFGLLPKLDRSPHNFHREYLLFSSFNQISKALDWIAKQA